MCVCVGGGGRLRLHSKIVIYIYILYITYGLPLMRPPLGNGKSGHIRGVAAGEGEL